MEPGSRRPGGARGKAPRTTAGHKAAAEPLVDVVLAARGWQRMLPRAAALARRAARAALQEAALGQPGGGCGAITVLLADDRALRRLNATHRGKDKPTNVLSFPAGMPGQLGDIALALGVVRREALAAGRRPAVHFAHLVAHGTLHLLGHDHLDAGEARRMEQAESRIMARLGLPNPWRVGAPGQPLGQFRGMAA